MTLQLVRGHVFLMRMGRPTVGPILFDDVMGWWNPEEGCWLPDGRVRAGEDSPHDLIKDLSREQWANLWAPIYPVNPDWIAGRADGIAATREALTPPTNGENASAEHADHLAAEIMRGPR